MVIMHKRGRWIKGEGKMGCNLRRGMLVICVQSNRDVAQPGSAPASGAGGRWFKSSHPDQILPFTRKRLAPPPNREWGFLFSASGTAKQFRASSGAQSTVAVEPSIGIRDPREVRMIGKNRFKEESEHYASPPNQVSFGWDVRRFKNAAMRENPAWRTGQGFCVLELVICGTPALPCLQPEKISSSPSGQIGRWPPGA